MKNGCKYGTHRSIEPTGSLPQPAHKISNDMEIYDNEILIDVQYLNIDSASFTQLKSEAGGDAEKLKSRILQIVGDIGKMKNPVTGSGGMLLGKVEKIGESLTGKTDLKVGDRIATLVSLSLTPLRIDEILDVKMNIDRVDIKGKAILFESGIYAKLDGTLPDSVALAALDVAGAPAQTAKLVKPGNTVLVLGAGGKSGMLCCYQAMKNVGSSGKVVATVRNEEAAKRLKELNLCHEVILVNAQNAVNVLEKSIAANEGEEFDISINCLNVPDCEMSCILPVKDGGTVYLFSMATSFTQAALGAEGVGKDVTMIIGNGYTRGHAEITLQILKESDEIRKIFEKLYI